MDVLNQQTSWKTQHHSQPIIARFRWACRGWRGWRGHRQPTLATRTMQGIEDCGNHLSMDWFCWENVNRKTTQNLDGKIDGFRLRFSRLNQSIESSKIHENCQRHSLGPRPSPGYLPSLSSSSEHHYGSEMGPFWLWSYHQANRFVWK